MRVSSLLKIPDTCILGNSGIEIFSKTWKIPKITRILYINHSFIHLILGETLNKICYILWSSTRMPGFGKAPPPKYSNRYRPTPVAHASKGGGGREGGTGEGTL